MRRILSLFFAVIFILAGCRTTPKTRPQGAAITVASRRLHAPRPLMVHIATVDLTHPDVSIVCAAAADPDHGGPAETHLLTPTVTFTNAGLTLAVNANAFSVVSPRNSGSVAMYVEKAPATFCGLAATKGRLLSRPQRSFVNFWADFSGRPHIGMPRASDRVREGVAGFGRLLHQGAIIPKSSDTVLHPRTAVGFSADRRTLWLVVVDGRDPGVSEGMSTYELAAYMRSLGAAEALNLDGGGSSVMLYAPPTNGLPVTRIINRPSTRLFGQPIMRPVPVLLGIRLGKP